MNYPEIRNTVKHLQSTCNCQDCNAKYRLRDINIIATTQKEGLFELHCPNCNSNTIVTVLVEKSVEPQLDIKETIQPRRHRSVSQNDVLDIKNFLNNFDGNFKKIFTNRKR